MYRERLKENLPRVMERIERALERSGRHLAVYDPQTQALTHVRTCFSTHHLMFAEDENHTLWTSGGGPVVGWLNSKMFLETGDAGRSQGWTALVLDTNGNGRRDDYVEPDQPVDPTQGVPLADVLPLGEELGERGAEITLDGRPIFGVRVADEAGRTGWIFRSLVGRP